MFMRRRVCTHRANVKKRVITGFSSTWAEAHERTIAHRLKHKLAEEGTEQDAESVDKWLDEIIQGQSASHALEAILRGVSPDFFDELCWRKC